MNQLRNFCVCGRLKRRVATCCRSCADERRRKSSEDAAPERFWAKTIPEPNTGCQLWLGSLGSNGYGRLHVAGRATMAHRMSWLLTYGAIPDGLWVLHRCDNPPCVNPVHLFLGTLQDNVSDMVRKDRHSRGDRSGKAKLSDEDARDVRSRFARHEKRSDIARRYGVTRQAIYWITTGAQRRHLR